jgi:nucleoside-diphosphate-sugar epimerase
LENIEPLLVHPRFTFVQHDVVEELPKIERLDRVYHLASPASPVGYTNRPIETLRVNSEGSLRLLGLAHSHDARLLYASTSEVYGDPLQHPQSEDYRGNVSCTGPRSMYDEGKRFGEALTMAFVRHQGADARVVRIFNTYGPRSAPSDGRLAGNLIIQALRGEPMTIYGNGRQTRSLCYVSDLVSGLIMTMESPRARGEIINLGNPDERSVLDCAKLVRDLVGSSSSFVFTRPAVGDDPQVRCPDIRKAQSLLGWSPRVGLRDGLGRTIAYFRRILQVAEVAAATPVPALASHGASARQWWHAARLRRLAGRRLDPA